MNKNILVTIGVVLLVAAVGAGAFYGGMLYERSQVASVRNAFFAGRGGDFNGTPPAGGFAFGGGNGQGGNGQGGGRVFGQIKTIDGNTLTISTPQNVTTVQLTAATTISKTVAGAVGDLKIGETINVRGQRDASSGAVTATVIQITGGPGAP